MADTQARQESGGGGGGGEIRRLRFAHDNAYIRRVLYP